MQDKTKLLVTASTFPRYEGDTEPRFVLDLCKELNKEYDVTVLVPMAPGLAREEIIEGVRVERYHYFPLYSHENLCYPGAIVPRIREKKSRIFQVPFLFAGLAIALFIRLKKYDMVHAHWIIPQGLVQCLYHKPYLLTGHGGDVTSLNFPVIRQWKKRAIRKAAHMTVVSEALRQEVLDMCPDAEVSVNPMGCDTGRFSPKHRREDFFKTGACGTGGNEKIILFVGRLAEKKGVKYLIEAMQWVEASLVIVGDGPLREELQEQTKTLKLQDKVTFLGAKSHEQLPEIYASADLFAAPSVVARDNDKEGFGLVILEAMASGLPVVASESGGITEIIRDKWNGLLCEEKNSSMLAEKINGLLYDEALRDAVCRNMKTTVQSYSYEETGRRYREILKQMEKEGGV